MIVTAPVWTHERLAGFSGSFTAATCGGCQKTANVVTSSGWFCACGHFNVELWSGDFIMPHERPDIGPTRAAIDATVQGGRP